MSFERYSNLRDALLIKIQDIMNLNELSGTIVKDIEAIRQKQTLGILKIVLMGQSRAGKSTTFNTFCAGREISPRSALIKTGVCRISAQNLSDIKENEYVIIKWKLERELIETMVGIIAPHLRSKEPERFGGMLNKEIIDELCLTNDADVNLIRSCLEVEWNSHPETNENYAELFLASVIIENFKNEAFRDKFVGKKNENGEIEPVLTRIAIDDLAKYVEIPKGWAMRCEQKNPSACQPDEVAFVFVDSVMCYLHSPDLARLGCVITDYSKLWSSPWDERVRWETMIESDAILYLFDGNRSLSHNDLWDLKEICSAKQGYKLLFAVNAKCKRDLIRSQILPIDVALLHNIGFADVNEDNVHIFDARLGLCARNGIAIRNNTLDSVSYERFAGEASELRELVHSDNAQELWSLFVEDELYSYLSGAEFVNKDIYLDDLTALGDVSGWNALLNSIEESDFLKKITAHRISSGSNAINVAICLLKGRLINLESLAIKSEEQFREEESKAHALIKTFTEGATSTISTIEEPCWAKGFAYDFLENVILASVENIASQFSSQFIDEVFCHKSGLMNALMSLNRGAIKANLEPLIRNAATTILNPTINGWLQNIKTGDNKVYNSTLRTQRQQIVGTLKRCWEELVGSDQNTLLYGLDKLIDGVFVEDFRLQENTYTCQVDTNYVNTSISSLIAGAILGCVITTLPSVVPILALLAVPTMIPLRLNRIKVRLKNTCVERCRNNLHVELAKPEVKSRMLEIGCTVVSEIQKKIRLTLQSAITCQRETFYARCNDAEKFFELCRSERMRILHEAKRIREEHVDPFIMWCHNFEKECSILT